MLDKIIIKSQSRNRDAMNQLQEALKNEGYDLSDIIVQLMLNRGIDTIEKAIDYLNPSHNEFYDPYLLKDMDKAVDLILQHIQDESPIVVYGDYDVDGITSTTVLMKTLLGIGAKASYYIPDRIEEGYGINSMALQGVYDKGGRLVISVDTGITAVEQVAFGKQIGLDIIVTDHHECQEEIPHANAVVNPKQASCKYPFKSLAGVGVTYKLIQALSRKTNMSDDLLKDLLEIVAVGTIADIVPLYDENRRIVRLAFKRIKENNKNKRGNIGLRSLLTLARVDPDQVKSDTIGFQVGPRLNAAGRLGDAKRGVELFMSEDEFQAIELAEILDGENIKRKEMEQAIFKEADRIIQETMNPESEKILVVASKEWHHGVIGIVASRITEKYYRPTILLTIEDGIASGSARSVDGFSIFDALMESKYLMEKFGGHEMAAGMSLKEEKVSQLRNELNAYASKHMTPDTLTRKVSVDCELDINDVTVSLVESLQALEPYGAGNPEPTFLIRGKIQNLLLMGKEKNHLKITGVDAYGEKELEIVAFYGEKYYESISRGQNINLVGSLSINEWKGLKKAQMFLSSISYPEDLQKEIEAFDFLMTSMISRDGDLDTGPSDDETIPSDLKKLARQFKIIIERKDCVSVYRELKQAVDAKKGSYNLMKNSLWEEKHDPERKILLTIGLILSIFQELKLIKILAYNKGLLTFNLNPGKKVELENSALYNYIRNEHQ